MMNNQILKAYFFLSAARTVIAQQTVSNEHDVRSKRRYYAAVVN